MVREDKVQLRGIPEDVLPARLDVLGGDYFDFLFCDKKMDFGAVSLR